MAIEHDHFKVLIEKLKSLPQERLDEVEDFIDFVEQRNRDRQLTQTAAQTAEQSFARIWDNTEDDVYDQL